MSIGLAFIAVATFCLGAILLFMLVGYLCSGVDHIGRVRELNVKLGYNPDGTPKKNQGETDS